MEQSFDSRFCAVAPQRDDPDGADAPDGLGARQFGLRCAVGRPLWLTVCICLVYHRRAGAKQALALYRSLYRPSPLHPKPEAVLCVWALAADTEAEAWR